MEALRFRLVTNGTTNYDGWSIDDVSVESNTRVASYPFSDDMESAATDTNWIGSTWRRITSESHSATHSWTDSPAGVGAGSVFSTFVLAGTLDLRNAVLPQLSFWHRIPQYLYNYPGRVSVSVDAGQHWTDISYLYDTGDSWVRVQLDLSQYAGLQDVALRFALPQVGYDGWYIDDVSVSNGP